ncbi:class I SAM-dependent methyltransferase [Marinobacter hydrocarbonoclasticus]|nr:class I SAM-dependent methyltransferase [Marinobacter nauticus]
MDHWDNYWQYSQQTVNDDAWNRSANASWAALKGAIEPHWRCLDLACGNGHLIQLLSPAGASWVGTDLARISPPAGIEFHARVPLQKQPFENAQFDLVVSQFGIEYGPRPDTFDEALRVLKPGGQFQFLMHHRHSTISRALEAENRDIEHLKSGQLSDAVEALIAVLARQDLARTDPAIVAAVESVKAALAAISQTASAGFVGYLNQGIDHVVNRMGQQSVEQKVDVWRKGLDALWQCHQRNKDQLDAALDAEAADAIVSQIGASTSHIECRLVKAEGAAMGWCLQGTKA